ncbi:glutamate synthase-related protein [Cyanobium sp. NIES-981]|uniref:glutamate synthase-related protein n=1 Tax=Cyanobium sp. NIES-981 TaxID=1851505 RepID=UPI0007DD2A61|nr:glutamate synthase-related protein [Cyanobium sp. NIES-981]SBO43870.1 Conserved region in glutamate synthase family [Cyanobium sp. NIES-981]
MTAPKVAARTPIAVSLEEGKEYYYCACGRSSEQPFCDGSHEGSGFTPLAFVAQKSGKAVLCRCKQTATPPYCDGTHARVPADRVGTTYAVDQDGDADSGDAEAGEDEEGEHEPPEQGASSGGKMPQPRATQEEPNLELIHQLAEHGLAQVGPQGPVVSMGVPRSLLPRWDDIQILTAQLARQPLADAAPVGTELVIGPRARQPLRLEIPLLVSDMSFGALSEEAKRALASGAELAGTGICSGEGGMLPAEQAANHRYLYELAPAMFGYREELLSRVQAFHFKAGQAAKTGVGGHLPGAKVSAAIAAVRGIPAGEAACSPASFADLRTPDDFRQFGDRVRQLSGGIPVGFKLSAQHIEADLDFALEAGADYLILDGRGGGTGASPQLLRDHIAVPTIPALARARAHLERRGASGQVSLIITGGIRTPADCIKALALGADGIALANAAIQAIGCVGSRICHTNRCPAGVATQDPALRSRLQVEPAAQWLDRFLRATVALMQAMARACGHDHLHRMDRHDLASWQRPLAELAGIAWSGAAPTGGSA